MSQEVPSAPVAVPDAAPVALPVVESPPPAAQPVREHDDEPRAHLHRLARQLIRSQNRRLLIEFLAVRRALR